MEILKFLKRRKARKAFRDLVGPAVVTNLEEIARRQAAGEQFVGKTQAMHFQFFIILLDEAKPEEVPALISKIVSTLLQHHAMLSNICSSLLVATLGAPFRDSDSPELRRKIVDAMFQENGDRIKIAHGQCTGPVGNMGAEGRWAYTEVIPDFSHILKKLLEIPLGSSVEVS